ncbi:MAG: hypothetical protein HY536_01815 [Candidatus Colwellbacteria bacterium]|nr:hypothetical protein [Candidatus Colwellbacteria bacterium]
MWKFRTTASLFIACIVLGLGTFYALRLGYYPAAVVNGSLIGARTLDDSVASVEHYYDQAIATYGELATVPQDVSSLELRRATLDKLIENQLIYATLREEIGEHQLAQAVTGKISALQDQNPDLKEAVATLYGLSFERFETLVLVPQARLEILIEQLTSSESSFPSWIEGARQKARVLIFEPDLAWDGSQVTFR